MDVVRPFDEVMEEALGTGAEVLVTGCPFCILNFEDSAKSMGKEEQAVVRDVVEILATPSVK